MTNAQKRQILAKAAKEGGYKRGTMPSDWIDSNRFGSDEVVLEKAKLLSQGVTVNSINKLYSKERPKTKQGKPSKVEERALKKEAFERKTGEKIGKLEAGKLGWHDLKQKAQKVVLEKNTTRNSQMYKERAKYREQVKNAKNQEKAARKQMQKANEIPDKKIRKELKEKYRQKLNEAKERQKDLKKNMPKSVKEATKEVQAINRKLFKDLLGKGSTLTKEQKQNLLNSPSGWKVYDYMNKHNVDLDKAIETTMYDPNLDDKYDAPSDYDKVIGTGEDLDGLFSDSF